MTVKTETCEKCGKQYAIGEWPFCPHGFGGKGGYAPFEEYIDPHILPYSDPRAHETGVHPVLGKITGTRITSREQRKRIMREQGLDWAPRPMGEGGSEV